MMKNDKKIQAPQQCEISITFENMDGFSNHDPRGFIIHHACAKNTNVRIESKIDTFSKN